MATNPYTSVSISGYNSSPPPDDGSQTDANEITWAKHKDKLADPIKNRQDTIDSRLVTAFGKVINIDAEENNAIGGSLAFTEKIFTIASGAITPTRSNVVLAAEGGTTDILDSMATGSVSDDCLMILSVDTGDTITINDAGGGAGAIHLVDSQDLVLSGNDRLFLIRDGADWYEIARAVDNQQIVQSVYSSSAAVLTGTTAAVSDDTIPQIGEGVELSALDVTITPRDTNNRLVIEIIVYYAHSASSVIVIALFQDTTANALAAGRDQTESANTCHMTALRHEMAAGTISATTFHVRLNATTGSTLTLNGESGARLLGGVMASHMRVTEYRT